MRSRKLIDCNEKDFVKAECEKSKKLLNQSEGLIIHIKLRKLSL